MTPELLLRLTIALGVVLYGAAEWTRATRGPTRAARALWTCALGCTIAHGLLAFHAYYGWSHAAAWEDTASKLDAAIGWRWGGGLIVNYAFYAVWTADTAWWWLAPLSYRARPRVLDSLVSALLLFIVLNGAVVFASGPVRIAGAAVVVLVLSSWVARASTRATQPLRS